MILSLSTDVEFAPSPRDSWLKSSQWSMDSFPQVVLQAADTFSENCKKNIPHSTLFYGFNEQPGTCNKSKKFISWGNRFWSKGAMRWLNLVLRANNFKSKMAFLMVLLMHLNE